MSAVETTDTVQDLDDEQVAELLSGRNQKGNYAAALQSFVESGARGRRYDVESGQFSGRNKQSVVMGFKNAVKKAELEGKVRVIGGEGFVALVNAQ